uniref:Uncharacterized protein n=1 Tax=Solanum lycopersicum TaxID=4081 RepID=A0A3Q7EEI4_SOLLC
MSISNEPQEFCVRECSCCKQKKRRKDKKDFERILEIDLIDGTPSATTSISDLLGETSFSVTTENIFDIICIKCFNHFEHFELIETFPGYVEYDISDVASGQHIPQFLTDFTLSSEITSTFQIA